MMTTQDRIKDLFEYNTQTGEFVRRVARGGQKVGAVAGSKDSYGYVQIAVDSRLYLAHRLALLYVTGEWPKLEVDHVNGNRADNSFANLRLVTRFENMANLHKVRSDNKTNATGVHVVGGKFIARIQRVGSRAFLGRFDTVEEASNAYKMAKEA